MTSRFLSILTAISSIYSGLICSCEDLSSLITTDRTANLDTSALVYAFVYLLPLPPLPMSSPF